jgi:hypothetical protein
MQEPQKYATDFTHPLLIAEHTDNLFEKKTYI